MKILVCDDQNPQDIESALMAGLRGSELAAQSEITSLGKDNLAQWIGDLFNSVNNQINGVEVNRTSITSISGFDLVILDYGLTTLENFTVRLTADMIAGYIRAFTSCGYVVSLNKNPSVDFDLKYLVGDFDTRADLALNTHHLAVPGLWDRALHLPGKFCPWYWPELATAADRRRKQVEVVMNHLDSPILDTLPIPLAARQSLSRQALAFLHPEADENGVRPVPDNSAAPQPVTFWNHFQNSNRTLPRNDREALVRRTHDFNSQISPTDESLREIVARVVAAELDFWFRRDILGPQRVLVDTPHLQQWLRYRPGNEAESIQACDRTASERDPGSTFGLDPEFYNSIPKCAHFLDQPWTDGPAFWLPLIEADEGAEKYIDSVARSSTAVFCEDTRRFLPRDNAKRFVSELTKGVDVRFVEMPESERQFQGYSPAVQLSL